MHTVKILSEPNPRDKKHRRYITVEVDGVIMSGSFQLTHKESPNLNLGPNANYRFHFPKECLLMKHKDWKEIRIEILKRYDLKTGGSSLDERLIIRDKNEAWSI